MKNNELQLQNEWKQFIEEMGKIIHEDFTELGIIDEETAIEYIQKFRAKNFSNRN